MQTILDKIVEYKTGELASQRRKVPLKDLELKARDTEAARPFLGKFVAGSFNVIAEIKKASPSLGVIRPDFKPVDIAQTYEQNGARALSVLTDEKFFQGHLSYLSQIKKQVSLPCLRKDFTLNEYHIYEARGADADAILLIAAILAPSQIKDYSDLCAELGMKALIEIHDQAEWEKISFMHPDLVGVNNRNLKTFEVSLETSKELVKNFPARTTRISESGIKTREDMEGLMKVGYNGFLIGEAFMKEKDPGQKLKELIG